MGLGKIRALGLVLALMIMLLEPAAFAAEQSSNADVDSNRSQKKLGAYISVGEPMPAIVGANLAYNFTDYLRASAGYGSISVLGSSANIFGVGVRGMVPGWNFTPTIGVHWAEVMVNGLSIGGFDESGSHFYTTFGFDWQTGGGFNLNAGYEVSLRSATGSGIYLGIGWFVNWLG